MKLVIFGASGGTGSQLLKQALSRGHRVTAFVRNPAKLNLTTDALSVVKGDVLDRQSVATAIRSDDQAVLSALGSMTLGYTNVVSRGTKNILAAMTGFGVRRFVCMSAAGFHDDADDGTSMRLVKSILERIFKKPYADLERMETIVRGSDAEWTIVLPSRLTNQPSNGTWHREIDRGVRNGWSVSRSSVADCMLDLLEDPATFHHDVYVSD